MYPKLPEELKGHSFTQEELRILWQKLVHELLDADYNGRTHHNRRTYDAGCKGPLCGKAMREHGRRRTSTAPNEKYKYLDPILDYWRPVAEDRIAAARAKMLQQLTA